MAFAYSKPFIEIWFRGLGLIIAKDAFLIHVQIGSFDKLFGAWKYGFQII